MELYTSLIRLKISLNNGVLPPMTPLTERAKKFIDPAFTPGMGALNEDVFKGLQCPVRGCGRWFHRLYQHLAYTHRNIGGCDAVRRALDIPATVSLASCWQRALGVEHLRAVQAAGRWHPMHGNSSSRGRRSDGREAQKSMVYRNIRDRCTAQVTHRLADLANKIGRSPSETEFAVEYGLALARHCKSVFGSWNSFLAQCELPQRRGSPRWSLEGLLAAYGAYYDAHHSLPSFHQAHAPTRTPLIPMYETVYRVLGTRSWPEAMRRVAAALGIVGGRYGLPAQERAS